MEFTVEQIEFMKSEEGKTLLNNNGVTTKIIDINSIIETEEGIQEVFKNPKISAELDRRNSKSFERFKNETLANYVEKSKLEEIETNYKSQLTDTKLDLEIEKALMGVKHSDLLKGQIDRKSLSVSENGITGLDEQLNSLREKYADLFAVEQTPKKTPPSAAPNQKTEITYEDYQKMTKAERKKVPEEVLNKLLKQ